jgi:hypothetical protein
VLFVAVRLSAAAQVMDFLGLERHPVNLSAERPIHHRPVYARLNNWDALAEALIADGRERYLLWYALEQRYEEGRAKKGNDSREAEIRRALSKDPRLSALMFAPEQRRVDFSVRLPKTALECLHLRSVRTSNGPLYVSMNVTALPK